MNGDRTLSIDWHMQEPLYDLPQEIREAVERTLSYAYISHDPPMKGNVTLILVGQEEMQKLNREERRVDRVTDVLSFPSMDWAPQSEGDFLENKEQWVVDYDTSSLFLGDIFLCIQRAREQAEEYGHGMVREMTFLFLHGFLHLLGYDHEEEEGRMFSIQREILKTLAITRD